MSVGVYKYHWLYFLFNFHFTDRINIYQNMYKTCVECCQVSKMLVRNVIELEFHLSGLSCGKIFAFSYVQHLLMSLVVTLVTKHQNPKMDAFVRLYMQWELITFGASIVFLLKFSDCYVYLVDYPRSKQLGKTEVGLGTSRDRLHFIWLVMFLFILIVY